MTEGTLSTASDALKERLKQYMFFDSGIAFQLCRFDFWRVTYFEKGMFIHYSASGLRPQSAVGVAAELKRLIVNESWVLYDTDHKRE